MPALSLVLAAAIASSPATAPDRLVVNRRVEPNQTIAKALRRAGLSDAQVDDVVSALSGVFEFKRSRPGDQLRVETAQGEVDFVDYRQGAMDEWQVRREGDHLVAARRQVDVEKKLALVELSVDSSVWEAAQAAGEDPSIAMDLSDVFAWDIDFYQDVRKGDRAKILVEKFLAKGRLVRYGEVLAASYSGDAVGHKEVYRYELPEGGVSYFQRDGSSARKTFLKSPLKYALITSGFGTRLHPILHYLAAHQGVDYAAAVGTPVWAVADGTVTRAGFQGGNGNHVFIRHPNGLETCYLHLSRFASGIHVGARVSQKQVIAYSGNTGLSTGPHLHFAMKRGGVFVNPLNQKFPRAEPVPKEALGDFRQKTASAQSWMDALPVASAVATPLP